MNFSSCRRRRIEERKKRSHGVEAGKEGRPTLDKKPPGEEGGFRRIRKPEILGWAGEGPKS